MSDADTDATLARARGGWLHPDTVGDLTVRWMRIARQEPKALDALARLSKRAPLEWQRATGADLGRATDRRQPEYAGHSDPDFTLRTCRHPLSSSETRTRKMIDDALRQ
ncbi:hypothetical protein AB0C70_21825 [Streptomyces sp. NPDC048564]|uniref:hypothetical protein n=1 Tax=Streptomyces sp. NPDC048564 TaxID=3155760 RepID=UPI0034437F7A